MEEPFEARKEELLEELLSQGNALLRYALGRVADRSTAEDLVQETLVAAVTKVSEFQGNSSSLTWLVGIMRHKIHDHYRWRNRHPGDLPGLEDSSTRGNDPWFTSLGVWRSDPNVGLEILGDTPDAAVERSQLRAALRRCIERLPKSLRRVFVLRELEELEPEEACDVAEISRESLAVFLYRARQSLRACMQKNWMEP